MKAYECYPTERQIKWQEKEFYAFIHFGTNTFSNVEWGTEKEMDLAQFNPMLLDTDQWCENIKAAKMTGVIITAKHHDGFCLWNTKYSQCGVMNTSFGRDIVKELSVSCNKYGLSLGIYLSPWDIKESTYGTGKAYDDYYINQLTELLTNYGDIFSVWLDGACGENSEGRKQKYDFQRYFDKIRELQPDAVISIVGPDVRWIGNEGGHTRESEWSVIPVDLMYLEKVQNSSQNDANMNWDNIIKTQMNDIASDEVIKDSTNFTWFPAEVNVSIRPGWFYHPEEDDKVKPVDELFDIYLRSVGGNATFLLNIPPNMNGLFAKEDVKVLNEFGEKLDVEFSNEISFTLKKEGSSFILDNITDNISYIVIQEDIKQSQRVSKFSVIHNGIKIYNGTTIGYKKICVLDNKISGKIEIVIEKSRADVFLKNIILY